jgi:diaminohydroxyphosphoribosylaminopyrimidine deaminase/5-amino-6-(5-phosphoribosylamino)uracil reductase
MTHALSPNSLAKAMHLAASEARKWMGSTAPNPPVGAVALDEDGQVIARTAHHRAGEAHAEAKLIEECRAAGTLSKIHTLCVTLEPCNHHGRTPPCCDALIASGVRHVAIGCRDPNPKVAGGGLERLKSAGMEVVTGINEDECRELIHAFTYASLTGKPWITIKRAFDKSGSAIPPPGQKTFTSTASLHLAHELRKKSGAIIAGSGTILVDDPLFTVRYVADYPGKRRFLAIIDRRGRVPASYIAAAAERGLDALLYQDIETALKDLTQKGVQDILVEAGPGLSNAMFDSHFWCMSVTIHQDDPDRIEVHFNSREPMPFAVDKFRWEWFLPK